MLIFIGYVAQNGRVTADIKLGRMRKKAFVAIFKVLPHNLP